MGAADLWAFYEGATSQTSVNNNKALRPGDFGHCTDSNPSQATDSYEVSSGVSGLLLEADDTGSMMLTLKVRKAL